MAILVPSWLLGGFFRPVNEPRTWLGGILFGVGAAIYFRCAWEFAVRGLGTPAPIAPTKYLVTTALHRYVRNPMYLGVALAIVGRAVIFRSVHILIYAALMLTIAGISSWCSMRNPRCDGSLASRMKNTGGLCLGGFQSPEQNPLTTKDTEDHRGLQLQGFLVTFMLDGFRSHSPIFPRNTVIDAFGSW